MLTQTKPKHIILLAGGPSAEREVSLQTGAAIEHALIELGYKTSVLDPQHDLCERLKALKPDLVFNALHGTYGEDGVIQGCLEWLGIPYTGSKVKSSAVAMDKDLSRRIFSSVGVPVADGLVWKVGQPIPNQNMLPPAPWMVKPTNEGSSVGLDHCESYLDLIATLDHKAPSGPQYWLIESFLEGTEISVVVFDGEVWGSVEISPTQGIYDYEAKYVRGDTTYYCPPRINQAKIDQLEVYALKAYEALDCRGVCRIDFMTNIHHDITLELNTLPGMTSTSLVPKVAAAKGVDFKALVESIIISAMKDN